MPAEVDTATQTAAPDAAETAAAPDPQYQAEDAFLDGAIGSDEGSSTRVGPDAKPPAAPATPKPGEKSVTDAADVTDDDAADDAPPVRKYLAALELDGYPAAEARRLAKQDPAAFERFGKAAAKRQADANRTLQELADLRKAKDQQPTRAEPDKGQPNDEIDALIQPIVEEYGEKGAEPIKKLAQRLLDRTKALEDKLARDVQSQVGHLNKRVLEIDTADARAQLKAEWPQLEDDSLYQQLEPDMRKQAQRGDYQTMRQLVDDAALLKYGRQTITELRRRLGELHTKRSIGQPTAPTRAPATGSKPLSKADAEDEALDSILT